MNYRLLFTVCLPTALHGMQTPLLDPTQQKLKNTIVNHITKKNANYLEKLLAKTDPAQLHAIFSSTYQDLQNHAAHQVATTSTACKIHNSNYFTLASVYFSIASSLIAASTFKNDDPAWVVDLYPILHFCTIIGGGFAALGLRGYYDYFSRSPAYKMHGKACAIQRMLTETKKNLGPQNIPTSADVV